MSAATERAATARAAERARRAVYSATFFVRFSFGLTLAVLATYIAGHVEGFTNSDTGVVGLVSSMAPLGEFSTVLGSGLVADRYGRFPLLFAGMASAGGLLALASGFRDPWSLAAINLGFGVASGAILASSLAVIADRSPGETLGFEMGWFDAMNLFGWVVGFAVGFAALGSLSFANLRWVFAAGAGVLFAGLALTAALARGLAPIPRVPSFSARQALRGAFRTNVLLVTLPWLVIYMLIGAVLVFLGVSAEGVGVSPTLLGAAIAAGGLVLVATQPGYGRLADRYGRDRLMAVGVVGFVLVMLWAGVIAAVGPQPVFLAAIAVSGLLALAYGPAALAALAELTHELDRATTMAVYSLTISLGMLLGLLGYSTLESRLGNLGLDIFLASIAGALVVLTALRLRGRPATTRVR